MDIIWHNNNFFPVHGIWEENNTVFFQTADVMKDNNSYEQQEQLVHNMFDGLAKPILAGGYINNASFQTINIGRKYDHIDWEEMVDDIEYCETREVVVIS